MHAWAVRWQIAFITVDASLLCQIQRRSRTPETASDEGEVPDAEEQPDRTDEQRAR